MWADLSSEQSRVSVGTQEEYRGMTILRAVRHPSMRGASNRFLRLIAVNKHLSHQPGVIYSLSGKQGERKGEIDNRYWYSGAE